MLHTFISNIFGIKIQKYQWWKNFVLKLEQKDHLNYRFKLINDKNCTEVLGGPKSTFFIRNGLDHHSKVKTGLP